MLKSYQKVLAVAVVAVAMTGCDTSSKDEAGKNANGNAAPVATPVAPAQATQEVVSPGGMAKLSIPAALQEQMSNEQIKIYAGDTGAVTIAEVPSPTDDVASLLDQTEANMKAADGGLQVLNKGDGKFEGGSYKLLEVFTTHPKQGPLYTASGLLVHNGKMLSVQVVGPQDKKAALSASAKAILESIRFQE